MAELQPISIENSLINALQTIGRFCISPNTVIEPGASIVLELCPGLEKLPASRRYTKIGDAHIESGANIEGQVHLANGALVEKGAHVRFRSTVGERNIVGHDSSIGIGVTLEQDVELMPNTSVGNFGYISQGSLISRGTELSTQFYIGPGLAVNGIIGRPHGTIKSIQA